MSMQDAGIAEDFGAGSRMRTRIGARFAALRDDADGIGWISIIRLGCVQAALGGVVALTTSTLNRIMVIEMALPAMLPALLVGLHYAVQISRPGWGYGSDVGGRRTPWIIIGMGGLCLGALAATDAALISHSAPVWSFIVSVFAYALIGIGVGAAGTSLLALLAARVAPRRRAAAASTTWIMMVVGIVLSAAVTGAMIEPYTTQRLAFAATGVAAVAFLATILAVRGMEPANAPPLDPAASAGTGDDPPGAADANGRSGVLAAVLEIWNEPLARRFALFVFVAMLAYSAQDLILEPFAGLVFQMSPGQTTSLSGVQHGGVLLGMILTGALGARSGQTWMRGWTVAGCLGSAACLGALAVAAQVGPGWPLAPTVFGLGVANGVFAVAAIGSMMGLAGEGRESREGTRVGLWGAAQALAFGFGGFLGAVGVDALRAMFALDSTAFLIVFALEAAMFVTAAWLATTVHLKTPGPAGGTHDSTLEAEMSR